jgi:hypothetical protein
MNRCPFGGEQTYRVPPLAQRQTLGYYRTSLRDVRYVPLAQRGAVRECERPYRLWVTRAGQV